MRCAGSVGSSRFHQPPPSAWNSAAVSVRRFGLRLDARQQRLLVGELGDQHDDVGRVADVQPAARDGEAGRRRLLGRHRAFSVSASYSSARNVSATLRKAVRTVDGTAPRPARARPAPPASWPAARRRRAASAAALRCRSCEPADGRPEQRARASGPACRRRHDRLICGNWSATATPTCAAAEWTLASAARMSGRCSTSRAGRLSGRSCRQLQVVELEALGQRLCWAAGRSGWRAGCVAGPAPSASGGKVASAWASAACWVATSAPEMAPRPAWPCRMPSVSRWAAMMRWVAWTWARSEASGSPPRPRWRRATDRRASSRKHCASASASSDSICRAALPPQTSSE